ncbi:MAG: GGDEF domain-containing protein [Lachnospiraceae bacterium]|nr:GGDEF domain-containing protein [Lachnospiraceae bacterium]
MRIAVLAGNITNYIQKRLLEGIVKYVEEKNISIDVFSCNGDMYEQSEYGIGELQIYNLPDLTQYDGIIYAKDMIHNVQIADELTQRIKDSGIPTVSIESYNSGMSVFYVDNREAMKMMVSHLIEVHGVKSICYLSGPKENQESIERLNGAIDAVREHGLMLDDDHIYYGNFMSDSGERLIGHLVKSGVSMPDAIICANDEMALGAYIELCRHGIRVGNDIRLTGYGNFSSSANLIPALTTVEKPQWQIGYEACKSLVEKEPICVRKFKVKYCYRGSCGCTEHREDNIAEIQMKSVQQELEEAITIEQNKFMVSDLSNCENLQDFFEYLMKCIVQMNFSFLYLCLCEEAIPSNNLEYGYRLGTDYSQRAYIPIAYEKGTFEEYPYFSCKEILPEECRKKIGTEVCIVMPIHFRRNCLGYVVVCGSKWWLDMSHFSNWLMNISNTLENIYRQNELKRLVKKLSNVWMLDSLTQVYNRAGFFHFADGMIEECKKDGVPIGIFFADINKLKQVNDGYGHEEGDFYIRSVASHIGKLKKKEQLLMRYGGDEFVVVGKIIRGNEFDELTENLNSKLEECRRKNDKIYEMSVSVGFKSAVITENIKIDSLIEEADREMYKMKKEWRDRK